MDDLFQDKLQLLELYYPKVRKDILEEFLTCCAGDVNATRSLIDGKPNQLRPQKRAAVAQASLTDFNIPENALILGKVPGKRHKKETLKDIKDPSIKAVSETGSLRKPRKVLKVITLNTPHDVKGHLFPYASFHLNFLPEPISERVVEDFLSMDDKFKQNRFYLFGNECELNHFTGMFSRPSAKYAQLVYNGLKRPRPHRYTESMEEMARYTENFMNTQIIPNSEKLQYQLNDPWTTDFCVINRYDKLLSNMDWHSDRLSHIGPHNYVASISFGATRIFRLRSTYKENGPIYQIPLPHNSLFIMRPGCQEEFKHCLSPMLRAIDVHSKLGTRRFGVTARCYPTFFIENLPKCECGTAMILRRSFKTVATRGKYFWLCENVYQNKGCSSFHWCDFDNVTGHYIAEKKEDVSIWIAPEDVEKLNHDGELTNNEQPKDLQVEY